MGNSPALSRPAIDALAEYRDRWQRKPVLRTIYNEYYRRIAAACRPGLSLEIGGGSGNLKQFVGDVISTDLVPTPWLDAAADAQALPFAASSFDNVVMVDVLHHIEWPRHFFAEAVRILRPGGRIILLEPAITPVSSIAYRFFHPEPVSMRADPLASGPRTADRHAFDANGALPTLLFGRHRARFEAIFPELHLVTLDYVSLFAYPLSGGFRPWSLIPAAWVQPILQLERSIPRWITRLMAFRLFAVLERQPDDATNRV